MSYSNPDFVDRLSRLSTALPIKGRQLIQYFPLLFIGLLIGIKAASRRAYWVLIAMEDGPVEYLTSVAYLAAAMLCILMIVRLYNKQALGITALMIGLMAALFFFVGMEEISWGQRIFSIQSPDFFEVHNYQQEITLHNMIAGSLLHLMYIVAGLYGAFAWKLFPKKLSDRFPKVSQFIIPDRLLQGYFLPAALLYIYYDYVSVFLIEVIGLESFRWDRPYGWIISRDQEPVEMLMSLGVMFFVCILFNRQTHGRLLE